MCCNGVSISPQAPLDGVTAAFYNAFFTSLPIGAFALFDRPVRRLGTLLAAPQAYNRKPPLTTRAFWKTGILTAIVHASVQPAQMPMLFTHVFKQHSDTQHTQQYVFERCCLLCRWAFHPVHRSESYGHTLCNTLQFVSQQGVALHAPFCPFANFAVSRKVVHWLALLLPCAHAHSVLSGLGHARVLRRPSFSSLTSA